MTNSTTPHGDERRAQIDAEVRDLYVAQGVRGLLAKCRELMLSQPVAQEAKDLYYELRGVIADVEQGNGFDAVCLETVKRVAAALAASHPSQGAEVVVPVEPTPEMVKAGEDADDNNLSQPPAYAVTAIYKAMIAAAPHPPVSADAGLGRSTLDNPLTYAEGDACPDCGKPMVLDGGEPPSHDHPGQAPSVYCTDCVIPHEIAAPSESVAARKYVDGWNAQTEFLGEYRHNGSTWALNFFAVDEEDAKRKIESIRASAVLLGRLEKTIPVGDPWPLPPPTSPTSEESGNG